MQNNIRKVLFAIVGISIATGNWSCGSKSQEESGNEQVYTPISLYLNPLRYGDNLAYSEYFPLFVNYPTDWAKCGLKNFPMDVSYDHYDVNWGASYAEKGWFNTRGQLVKTLNTGWGKGNDNTYDDEGHLVEIIRYYPSNGHSFRVPVPEYQDSLISSWWRLENVGYTEHNYIFNGVLGYKYSYYPEGSLQSLEPKLDSYLGKRVELGKMEFDDKGQLQRIEAPFTANPFLSDLDTDLFNINVVSTFQYDDRGLCKEKTERLFMERAGFGVERHPDTIVSVNRYVYNDNGDLLKWTYDGGTKNAKYANAYTIEHINFEFNYRYKYDDKGNWTEMLVELPTNFQENYVLANYYERTKKDSPFEWNSQDFDGARMIVLHRSIGGYYEADYAEIHKRIEAEKMKTKEEEQNQMPKYTGAMAYGLQGPVKMVKNDSTKLTTVFNKIGNIESLICKNGWNDYNFTYIYETPFRYRIESSPYRIECNGNTLRFINENDEDTLEFEDEYEFDSQGRVIKHVWYEGMSPVTHEFAYQDDSLLPYKETESSFDEMGDWSTTITYEYIDVDKHGNWTKRKGTSHTQSSEYVDVQNEDGEWVYNGGTKTYESTDTVEETRKISYY